MFYVNEARGRALTVDFSKIPIFAMMQHRMNYLSERQAVLSKNIANANTPDYIAQDLKPLDFGDMAKQAAGCKLGMKVTDPSHLSPAITPPKFRIAADKNSFETTPQGNSVVLEEQMLKMQHTNTDYKTTTSLYRKMGELFKIATGTDR